MAPSSVQDSSTPVVNGSAVPIVNGTLSNKSLATLNAPSVTEYDVLIVGTGPAGASLACFLSSHGITGLMISSASSSADTLRAHITNIAALEALRDVGLDIKCAKLANSGGCMMHTRWCHSMAAEEYA